MYVALRYADVLHPAILAKVQGSHPLAAKRVRNVWRKAYSTNGFNNETPFFLASSFSSLNTRACCFLTLE